MSGEESRRGFARGRGGYGAGGRRGGRAGTGSAGGARLGAATIRRAVPRAGALLAVVTALSPAGALDAQDRSDIEAVRDVAQAYLDGLLDADTAKLVHAFAPQARLYGVPGRALDVIPVDEWIASRAGKPLRPTSDYVHRVVSVDVAGEAAFAKVDLMWPKIHYVDYLSLLRMDGEWRIVNKIWHQEPSPRALAALDTRSLPTGRAERYLGGYATESSRFRVVRAGDELALQMGGKEYRLYYQGDDTFAPEFDPATRLRFVVEGGTTSEITIEQDGGGAVARRTGGG